MAKWFIVPAAVLMGIGGGLPAMVGMGIVAAVIVLFLDLSERRSAAAKAPAGQQSAAPGIGDAGDRIALLFEFEDFLADAASGGLIDGAAGTALQREIDARRRRLFGGYPEVPANSRLACRHVPLMAPPKPPAPTEPAAAPPPSRPAVAPEPTEPAPIDPVTPNVPPRPPAAPSLPLDQVPTRCARRTPSSPQKVAAGTVRPSARPAAPKAPSRVAPQPEPAQPGRFAVTAKKVRAALVTGWKSFASDVAINTFTYLGVLLLVVVTFSFFSFGFFGEVFSVPDMRPFVEAGIPLVLFGVAWLLRSHTGIPFTANAIGLIGALVLPIMLSASFQDGSIFPPDVNGPGRWMAYAAVGFLLALIYTLAAMRSRMYAYLVGPGIWAGVGALGLYLEDGLTGLTEAGPVAFTSDGISGAQMVLVAFAIALTVPLARAIQTTWIGKRIAMPLVRMATISLPAVAAVAVAFLYSDAELAGIARPGIRDMAPELPLAMLAIGGGAFAARRAGFAWASLGPKLRSSVEVSLTVTGFVALAGSLPVLTDLGVTVPWLGVGYVVVAISVAGLAMRSGGGRIETWFVRLTAVGGLSLSLGDPGSTIAGWSVLLAAAVAVWQSPGAAAIGDRVLAVDGDHPRPAPAALIAVPLLVIIGPGAARLAWEIGTPWVLAISALSLAATRFSPEPLRELRPLAVVPAALTATGAVATASWLAVDGVLMAPGLSGVLALAAVTAFVIPSPPAVRTLAMTGLGTAAVSIELRHLLIPEIAAAQVDAMVFGVVAIGLVVLSSLASRLPRPAGATAEGLGLAGSVAALALGAPDDIGIVVGLGSLVAAFGTVGLSSRLRRSPLTGIASQLLATSETAIAAAATTVAAATLPFLTVLGGELIPLIADEPPRSGLVLVATSWLYVALAAIPRSRGARHLFGFAGVAVGVAGIVLTSPSLTGSVIAFGSLAALLGVHAVITRSPGAAGLGWITGVLFALLTAHRAGVEIHDLRFVVFGIAAVLVLAPAGIAAIERAALRSPWLWPPLALGLALLPTAVALGVADRPLLGVIAFGAAAVYLLFGWMVRNGAVALAVAVVVAIGYAHHIEVWHSPFAEPMVWMPLVGLIAVAAVLAPAHGPFDPLRTARPGLLAACFGLNALALITSGSQGATDWVTLATTGVLGILAAGLRSPALFSGALGALVVSGLLFGGGWSALALFGAAVAIGALATVMFPSPQAQGFAGIATIMLAGSYAALATWLEWSARVVVGWTAAAAVVLVVPAMVWWLRGVGGRVGIWVWPLHALAQAGAVTVVAAAEQAAGSDAAGIAAAVLAVEAMLAVVVASVRIQVGWASGAAALLGAAYAGLAVWLAWTPRTLIGITGIAAGCLAAIATIALLSGRLRPRGVIWVWPAHGLAQLGAATVLIAGFDRLQPVEVLGVLAAVSAGEALLVGLGAAIGGRHDLAAGATGMVGIAYAALVGWLQWPGEVIAVVTAPVSVGVGSVGVLWWLVARRIRIRIWAPWMHLLGQIGIFSSVIALSSEVDPPTLLWVGALICAGEAVLAALAASRLPDWPLRPISVMAALASGALALGAAGGGPIGLPLSAGLLILAGGIAIRAAVRDARSSGTTLWILAGGFAAESLLFTTLIFGVGSLQVATVLGIAGAALAMLGVGTGRWGLLQGGLLLWLGPIVIVGNRLGAGQPHLYVVGAAVILLTVVEIERMRRRAEDRPIPEQLILAEWAFLAVPMGLAALDTIDRSMAYALLLGVEAALVLLWSLITEIRRRLLLGTAGLTVAVLLPVAITLAHSAQQGLASGTWLSVGAIASLCFILIGSLLEKNRARLGRMVGRISHSLEQWE